MSSNEIGTVSRILPNLLLGDLFAERQLDLLRENKVTHILPIGMNLKPTFPELFVYFNKEIDVLDKDGEDLLSYFDECCEFIEEGCKIGTVLVLFTEITYSGSYSQPISHVFRFIAFMGSRDQLQSLSAT